MNMKKNTKKLLEKVATKKLEEALSEEKNDEEKSKSLKDGLDAIDKLNNKKMFSGHFYIRKSGSMKKFRKPCVFLR